ncbi:hypothetical protein Tco_0961156 [Tanacetum coccineum]
MATLESPVSRDEVRNAVWGCGENKSPGPDGFSFEFFRKFWDTVEDATLRSLLSIPKNQDPKFVNDYRPISLIGSLYKASFGLPFIINELLSWCKHKKQQAMVFKVDFAKAYDSIRWDFLEDVLTALVLVLNGARGIVVVFILVWLRFCSIVMESLHLLVSRAIEAGIFKGIKIDSTLNLSHLFYADDVVFIGEWSPSNLSGITNILHCFSLLSGLSINLKKSNLLGVGVRSEYVKDAADTSGKLKASALQLVKLKTLSGRRGRLTLLNSVLRVDTYLIMSIYKAPNLGASFDGVLAKELL